MPHTPFFDPLKSYQENFDEGPFGAFVDGETFQQTGEPQNDFLGQPVYLPFGIAAGPLLNGKFVKAALQKGFDLASYKTVRTRVWPSNPWPNVLPLETAPLKPGGEIHTKDGYVGEFSVTNSFGVPSFDPSFWQKDMAEAAKSAGKGQVVIGSFQGTSAGDGNVESYIADFALGARLVKETGVKILEVNLSCPNEGAAHLLCFDTERSRQVVEAIRKEIGDMPLIIKIAYFADDGLDKLVGAVGSMVSAISTVNALPGKVMDAAGKPALGADRPISGVGGPAAKWAGLESVARLRKIREEKNLKYKIVGVGGVANAEDYKEYVAAGADAVMSASRAMWNPYMAQEIKQVVSIK